MWEIRLQANSEISKMSFFIHFFIQVIDMEFLQPNSLRLFPTALLVELSYVGFGCVKLDDANAVVYCGLVRVAVIITKNKIYC